MNNNKIREKIHDIIFEADSKGGKFFDVALLWLISFSVIVVMLESIKHIRDNYYDSLYYVEWFFTIIFTIEYIFRIYSAPKRLSYIFSFFGIIDLLSIIPTYVGIFVTGVNYILIVRVLRFLRMFRVLKMVHHIRQGNLLFRALKASMPKIIVFLFSVLTSSLILGTIMYLVEGNIENSKFTSIPVGVYWAIVTITTVGYGDIVPISVLGKLLSAATMFIGYGIIAVPTGIIGYDIYKEFEHRSVSDSNICLKCEVKGHLTDANFCFKCGKKL